MASLTEKKDETGKKDEAQPYCVVSSTDEATQGGTVVSSTVDEATQGGTVLTKNALQDVLRRQRVAANVERERALQLSRMSLNEEQKSHKFWDTQPMGKLGTDFEEDERGPIQEQTVEEIRKEPYNMPAGFEWCEIDVHNPVELEELYQLLNQNYVEDDDNMFRFDYSKEFLMWALTPPEYTSQYHVGVRNAKNNKLMACITGVPATMRVIEDEVKMVEINFLCVHKKLRHKRLAPVLIKEVTRRVNCNGVFQAVYTAGVRLPKPIGVSRYFHRSLNAKKLIEMGFSRKPKETMTWARVAKFYAVPKDPNTPGFRAMVESDVPSATKLLREYLSKFKVAPLLSEEEVRHWILPRQGVVNAYVTVDEAGNVNNLGSFYHLPSSVMKCEKHNKLNACYSYYNVATTVSLTALMRDNLTMAAHYENQDVFNALNLMENEQFIEPLKFGKGDGNLHYYLYNWKVKEMKPSDIGLVLL